MTLTARQKSTYTRVLNTGTTSLVHRVVTAEQGEVLGEAIANYRRSKNSYAAGKMKLNALLIARGHQRRDPKPGTVAQKVPSPASKTAAGTYIIFAPGKKLATRYAALSGLNGCRSGRTRNSRPAVH